MDNQEDSQALKALVVDKHRSSQTNRQGRLI